MRRCFVVLLAATSLSVAAGKIAAAADLSMPPPVYKAPPPVFSWTGWYVGVNGGGGWGQTSHTLTAGAAGLPALTTGNFNTSGGIAGGTLGYNYQMGTWRSALRPIWTGPTSKAPSMAQFRFRAERRRSR